MLIFFVKLTHFDDFDRNLSKCVGFTKFFFSNWVVLKFGIDFVPREKTNTKFQYHPVELKIRHFGRILLPNCKSSAILTKFSYF